MQISEIRVGLPLTKHGTISAYQVAVKKNILIYTLAAVGALLLVLSCNSCSGITAGITKVTDAITNPSAREVYIRGLAGNAPQLAAWQQAYTAALHDSLTVTLPYGEKGAFTPGTTAAYSYTVTLQEGEVLTATIAADSLHQQMFVDILSPNGSAWQTAEANRAGERRINYVVQNTGSYKIIIQPQAAAGTPFFISLGTHPLYAFPVAGKGNAAIGSFWGMERDGGKRSHEGIDIFAPRGTPVLAATDGYITYTGEKGLGGRQVWLRSGVLGNSLYYAHLDSIAVQGGATVKTGDTLGFVGNTGNARTTTPHLHFGIYKSGAINPLPFVYQTTTPSESQFSRTYTTAHLTAKAKANLRQGPATTAATVGTLLPNDTTALLGQHNDWLHIQTTAGQTAFVHKSLVKQLR